MNVDMLSSEGFTFRKGKAKLLQDTVDNNKLSLLGLLTFY